MQYLFILGRNPELSILELKSYFGNFKYDKVGNALLAEINNPEIGKGIISKFGGIIAIGEVISQKKDFKKTTDKKVLFAGSGNRLNYVVWEFSAEHSGFYDDVKDYLKSRFKEERFKATEKKISSSIKLDNGEEVANLSSKRLMDEQYFVFKESFGRIIETCDYKKIEKQDMEKPVRREELAISPRLAKIMIGLSKIKKGETLVDPFCGIGVILQEALSQGFQVIGVDSDPEAIEGLRKNLKWGKFAEKDYHLINTDSSKVRIRKAKAVVTEPDLGEILKGIPNKAKTAEMLLLYENLMIKVLNNLKYSISGRYVFTAPFIKTSMEGKPKRIGCNIERILDGTGLHLALENPISESRENQIVGRQIFVLER